MKPPNLIIDMSSLHEMLELDPGNVLPGCTREDYTGIPHRCGYCRGAGVFGIPTGKDEYREERCPVCKGSGLLRAEVTIQWEPVKSKKHEKI